MLKSIRGTVNHIELIGWTGDEPQQRLLASGATVCNFRLATKRRGAKNEAGERSYETTWITVEAWDRLAAICLRQMHKGSRVRVVGSLLSQSWDDKATGQRRYKTVVRAEDVIVLDSRPSDTDQSIETDQIDEAEETEDIPF